MIKIIFSLYIIGVWGPFLIVSPSSTLHNWQQEIARFVPTFKVVPYWGNPQVLLLCTENYTSNNNNTYSV